MRENYGASFVYNNIVVRKIHSTTVLDYSSENIHVHLEFLQKDNDKDICGDGKGSKEVFSTMSENEVYMIYDS